MPVPLANRDPLYKTHQNKTKNSFVERVGCLHLQFERLHCSLSKDSSDYCFSKHNFNQSVREAIACSSRIQLGVRGMVSLPRVLVVISSAYYAPSLTVSIPSTCALHYGLILIHGNQAIFIIWLITLDLQNDTEPAVAFYISISMHDSYILRHSRKKSR
jgi:hypothetical protein